MSAAEGYEGAIVKPIDPLDVARDTLGLVLDHLKTLPERKIGAACQVIAAHLNGLSRAIDADAFERCSSLASEIESEYAAAAWNVLRKAKS